MPIAIGGVLAGFIGPKVGWGRWTTYLIGAIFAALIVPLLAARVAFPGGVASLHDLYTATATSVVNAYMDLAIRNLATTTQYLHHITIIGILVWATSMFASYAVFGHHRPLNAVVVVGVALVGNMALTENDELVLLIAFSVASLFLLIRAHVFDEQSEWLRRRIGDPATISSVYLRGGTIFIAVAVAASVLLTQTAASKPLAGAWDGVEDGLISLSRAVSRFLPTGGSSRAIGLAFGPERPGRPAVDHRRVARDDHPAQPDRQRPVLLARHHLRQDRSHGLGPSRIRQRRSSRPAAGSWTSARTTSHRSVATASRSRSRRPNSGKPDGAVAGDADRYR